MVALIAAIDAAKDKPEMYTDEDFIEDPEGEWIKRNNGRWDCTIGGETILRTFLGPSMSIFKTAEDPVMKKALDEELLKMSQAIKYRLVTTYEQRLVRYAAGRAKEIVRGKKKLAEHKY